MLETPLASSLQAVLASRRLPVETDACRMSEMSTVVLNVKALRPITSKRRLELNMKGVVITLFTTLVGNPM